MLPKRKGIHHFFERVVKMMPDIQCKGIIRPLEKEEHMCVLCVIQYHEILYLIASE